MTHVPMIRGWTLNSYGVCGGVPRAIMGAWEWMMQWYYYVPSSLHFLLFWGDMWCGCGVHNYPHLLFLITFLPAFWSMPSNGTEGGWRQQRSAPKGSQRSTLQWRLSKADTDHSEWSHACTLLFFEGKYLYNSRVSYDCASTNRISTFYM